MPEMVCSGGAGRQPVRDDPRGPTLARVAPGSGSVIDGIARAVDILL